MKQERDKSKLARDKPGGGTPIFEGQRVSEALWSAISVKAGDGEPCHSKATRVINVLEITEVREEDDVGIRASAQKKVV